MIPAPRSSRPVPGGAVLRDGLTIEADEAAAGVARLLRSELERATGWAIDVAERAVAAGVAEPAVGVEPDGTVRESATIRLRVEGGSSSPESYSLSVADGRIEITASGEAGAFYGTRTLLQLLPPEVFRSAPSASWPGPDGIEVGGIEIEDGPRFAWRGIHLDVSRHFMPKSFVLRLIDLASLVKLNVLHLHLTDDQGWRVESERYPRLTEVGAWRRESAAGHGREGRFDGVPHGGFYTKADLREIVAYAALRFVTVLPEVDMPGHMVAAIAAYPELGNFGEQHEVMTGWGISEHVLNLEPATLRFCTDVLDEVLEIFPARFVHTGGDECPTAEWEKSPDAQRRLAQIGGREARDLQAWFTSRIAEHLEERGRVLVGWDEIIEGGAPAGSLVMAWRHQSFGVEAAIAGHDVVMAPMQWTYFDWAYEDDPAEPLAICPSTNVEKVYRYEPVPAALPAELRHRVVGAQCQLWTEYVATPEHAEYMYFPRATAFAEVVWSPAPPEGVRDFGEFSSRLAGHLRALDALGVNYRPVDGPTPGQAAVWR